MAKDAKGHGSDARGGSGQNVSPGQMEAYMRFAQGFTGSGAVKDPGRTNIGVSDAQAANALAGGGAKSDAVPVHGGATGRNDDYNTVMAAHEKMTNALGPRDAVAKAQARVKIIK